MQNELVIKHFDKGPNLIEGNITLIDEEGNKLFSGAKIYLCACGRSSNKPFCDGTHKEPLKNVGITP